METQNLQHPTVLVASPCKAAHIGIADILRRNNSQFKITLKYCPETLSDLEKMLQKHPSACLILDPLIKDFDLIKTPPSIRKRFPLVKIITATTYYSHINMAHFKEGIYQAYLLKSAEAKHYHQAIRSVVFHNTPYLHHQALEISDKIPSLPFKENEWKTFYMLLRFKNHTEIEAQLNKSSSSVSAYISKIYQVTKAENLISLIKFAINNHFTSYAELESIP